MEPSLKGEGKFTPDKAIIHLYRFVCNINLP